MRTYVRRCEFKYDYKFLDEDVDKNIFITDRLVLDPLYKSIDVTDMTLGEVFPISKICIDLFCKKCMYKRKFTFVQVGDELLLDENGSRDETAYTRDGSKEKFKKFMSENAFFEFAAKGECGHDLYMLFERITENSVRKIGQTPSPEELDESQNKPSIKTFLELYNRPMYEFEINRIEDEEILKIKKRTFDEVNIYNELEVKNKISRYECNKSKNDVYEKEKDILLSYYNNKYNIPYGHKSVSGREIEITYFNLVK